MGSCKTHEEGVKVNKWKCALFWCAEINVLSLCIYKSGAGEGGTAS